jgi:outer membrane murein-binding lipoprotein Lpp
MNLQDGLLVPLAKAIAVAAVIGGGTVLLSTKEQNAVQDQRIETLEHATAKIDDIDRTIRAVDTKVDVLTQKVDDSIARRSR